MSVLCAIVSCEVKGTLELNLATVTCNGIEVVKCSLYSTNTLQYSTVYSIQYTTNRDVQKSRGGVTN